MLTKLKRSGRNIKQNRRKKNNLQTLFNKYKTKIKEVKKHNAHLSVKLVAKQSK